MTDHPADISLPLADDAPPPPEGSRFGKAHHILISFCALALIVWILSGIYTVNTDEVAIVERLGTYISTAEGKPIPVEKGLHYHIPWPIDIIHKVPIQRSTTLYLKTFNEPVDANAETKGRLLQVERMPPEIVNALYDPYLITGDKNVVHMEIDVQYRIDDPGEWLNTVARTSDESPDTDGSRENMLRRLFEHTLTEKIATVEIDHILYEGSDRLPPQLGDAISKNMELPDPSDPTGKHKLSMGVFIEKVDVVSPAAPQAVQEAFNQVFQARENLRTTSLQADAYAEGVKTKARADAANLQTQADAYASQIVDTAKGEAARFAQVYQQYQIAPDITRFAVYQDAVNAVQASATRVVFAQPGQHLTVVIDPPQFDPTQQPQNTPR